MSSAKQADLTRLIYVLSKNGTFNAKSLNVKPDVSQDLKDRFNFIESILLNDSNNYNFAKAIDDFNRSEIDYNNVVNFFRELLFKFDILTDLDARILVSMADGTVIFDSSRSDGDNFDSKSNTYQNYLKKIINENHNSRTEILSCQLYQYGLGYGNRYSTTLKKNETYVSLRVGLLGDSKGTVRYSLS